MILSLLIDFISFLPMLIIYIVALTFAAIRWPRHPRSSLFTFLGVFSLLLIAIIQRVTFSFTPSILYATKGDYAVILGIMNLVFNSLTAGGWVLILLAIFSDRAPRKDQNPLSGYSMQPMMQMQQPSYSGYYNPPSQQSDPQPPLQQQHQDPPPPTIPQD